MVSIHHAVDNTSTNSLASSLTNNKALLQGSRGEFPEVFEGGLNEPRCFYKADWTTFYASSQVEEASDRAQVTVAVGGNNRPDTRALSLAVAVAILAGFTAPVQAGSNGPEPLPAYGTKPPK